MRKITPEQEHEIFIHYVAGVKKSVIQRAYNITHSKLAFILKRGIEKEENKINK